MIIEKTFIDNLFIINYNSFNDNRGEFVKTIHDKTFEAFGLDYSFKESFFSVSNKDVIRGMHFQLPPDDHDKLIYLISGKIIDVVLDIRKESKTYGKYYSVELDSINRKALYIGKGLAHGFVSLEQNSVVEYHTTTPYSSQNESGIHYNSFGFNWGINNPLISDRDLNFEPLDSFENPF